LLRNIGDVLGDAFGGAAGVLGSRLRRGRQDEPSEDSETVAEAEPVS
jgi:hypothetical protein